MSLANDSVYKRFVTESMSTADGRHFFGTLLDTLGLWDDIIRGPGRDEAIGRRSVACELWDVLGAECREHRDTMMKGLKHERLGRRTE